MSTQAIFETLQKLEFFQEINVQDLEKVAEISRFVEYQAQSDLFHEYERGKDIFMILSGKVSLVLCTPDSGCRQLMSVGEGEFVGWSPLVDRQRLFDTAHTLEPTKAIAIDAEKMLELCESNSHFGYQFMRRVAKVLAERLCATRSLLLDISGVKLPEAILESD